jgi:hypothetical protein
MNDALIFSISLIFSVVEQFYICLLPFISVLLITNRYRLTWFIWLLLLFGSKSSWLKPFLKNMHMEHPMSALWRMHGPDRLNPSHLTGTSTNVVLHAQHIEEGEGVGRWLERKVDAWGHLWKGPFPIQLCANHKRIMVWFMKTFKWLGMRSKRCEPPLSLSLPQPSLASSHPLGSSFVCVCVCVCVCVWGGGNWGVNSEPLAG